MVRRYLAIATIALTILACDKKREQVAKGSTTGSVSPHSITGNDGGGVARRLELLRLRELLADARP